MLDRHAQREGVAERVRRRARAAGALLSAYEGIEPVGTYGGHLRGLYADFLDEAAALLEAPRLAEAATAYRELAGAGTRWPSSRCRPTCPEFAALREELAALHESVVARGDAGREEAAQAAERLWALRARARRRAAGRARLRARSSAAVAAIYEAEVAAAARLTG